MSFVPVRFWIFVGLIGLASWAGAEDGPTSVGNLAVAVSTYSWRTVSNTAFGPNEEFVFAVRFGMLKAGQARISVLGMETIADRPTYHLVSEARSSGMVSLFYSVKDRNDTWLDAQSLSTVRYEKKIRERHYRIEETAMLDQVNHHYESTSYRADKGIYELQRGSLPPYVLDVLGSFFYVRTLPLVVGESYTMDVYSGEKVWPLVMQVKKRETIKVGAGKFDCFLIEPILREPGIFVSKGKKLEVWLTADEKRMPVLMRAEIFVGHVSVALLRHATLDHDAVN